MNANPMRTTTPRLEGVILFEPSVFSDDRGFFFESYTSRAFTHATGLTEVFVQDNHSRSARGVVRGLHYQMPPNAQGKLVRCIRGEVYDVVVDVRKSSDTLGQWMGSVLSEGNKKQLWIPIGFAHGYLALSEPAEVVYKNTAYYAPESERSIRWNDPAIGITWPEIGATPILTEKDAQAPLLQDAEIYD